MVGMKGEKTLNTSSRGRLYSTKLIKNKVGKTTAGWKKKQAQSRKQSVDVRPYCTFKYALLVSLYKCV